MAFVDRRLILLDQVESMLFADGSPNDQKAIKFLPTLIFVISFIRRA